MADNVVPIREANALCVTVDDVAQSLRDAAEWIQDNDYGEINTVVMVIESADGELYRLTFGRPTDRTRVLGLLSTMVHRMATGTDR